MRTSLGILGIVAAASVALLAQSSPLVGTWKEDFSKAKLSPAPANGVPKERTLKWEPAEGGLQQTVDTVTAQNQKTHIVVIEKADGSEGHAEGDPTPTTRALKRINDRVYEEVTKQNGKVTVTRTLATSTDGKTLTITAKGVNGQGQPMNNVDVFVRQ